MSLTSVLPSFNLAGQHDLGLQEQSITGAGLGIHSNNILEESKSFRCFKAIISTSFYHKYFCEHNSIQNQSADTTVSSRLPDPVEGTPFLSFVLQPRALKSRPYRNMSMALMVS
jgi:hypothetical protein